MASLSSHPLPASALRDPALQRIYERTPPSPKAEPVLESGPRATSPPPPASAVEQLRHESGARPRTLGERYELTGYLDSGGTADVFTAIDRLSGALVAVKILKPKALADARLRHYFLQGARGAQRVFHPNLLRVLEVVDPPDSASFAVMEIVQGSCLSTLLEDHRTLAPSLVAELTLQAAAGLSAAHRAGVVHCDVKPENMMVELTAEGPPRLKVIDFDLAALDDEIETHEHPMLRGTAKYMAPEQVVGDRVDARTDVYSLGVVMFRMLTGHLPFDLELCPTLLWHQFASPAPPPSWLCDGLDSRLEAIVLRALRKAPDNRYPSMSHLAADLRSLELGGELFAHGETCEPDAYVPQSAAAREAARAIARCV
jgi:serine/threonine protein kinase